VPLFDTYIIVDWSASNVPKRGKDSIWICRRDGAGEHLRNPSTRFEARKLLAGWLATATARNERVLVGFDFPFGYPAGFADRLKLSGIPWRATWDLISKLIRDSPNNSSNRFKVGAELNRRISCGLFPFWGCPTPLANLSSKFHNRHGVGERLAERRLIDTWMVGAQPCWKLAYAGSVGSQILTGIPIVRALRDDHRWAGRARVWPFETGLRPPHSNICVVFAEVWPSWWPAWKSVRMGGEINDRAQVRHVAKILRDCDHRGTLKTLFYGGRSIGPIGRRLIEREEAWTLGVTKPRPKRSSRMLKTAK
jgi:precorrin-8X/cobalt-precorrin-8 methylmutase